MTFPISDSQMDAFKDQAETAFEDKATDYARKNYPAEAAMLSDPELQACVRQALALARQKGLTWESSLLGFVGLFMAFGPNFPGKDLIQSLLDNPDDIIDKRFARLGALPGEALDELKHKAGEKLAALEKLGEQKLTDLEKQAAEKLAEAKTLIEQRLAAAKADIPDPYALVHKALFAANFAGLDVPPGPVLPCDYALRRLPQPEGAATGAPDAGPASPKTEDKTHWIEVVLVDSSNRPAEGVKWRVTAADGEVFEGVLDHTGMARVAVLAPGEAVVTFPDLDRRRWKPA